MRGGWIAIAAMAMGGCTAAREAVPAQTAGASSQACALSVAFGSYAMGIDRPALQSVEALLAADRAVTKVDRSAWGREGEVTLCASTRTPGDARRLGTAIGNHLPADPRGPITVTTADGFRVERARATP